MAKVKTVYICQNCGAQSPKWIGKCNSCQEWNTYVEEVVQKASTKTYSKKTTTAHATTLKDISSIQEERIDSKINEFNRILGGGIVPGSLILLGGEPGIGKSTLALQVALQCNHIKTLYVSGEESLQQIKFRSERLKLDNENCYFLTETNIHSILQHIQNLAPDMVIIDSIQTIFDDTLDSSPGSVTQLRECTLHLQRDAKGSSRPILLIGHINKEGSIAGPKVLEHIVDTVLQFEGDHNYFYRILRSVKNRFGATSELGIFEMRSGGLVEIDNPSEILVSKHEEDLSGVAVSATIDGIRPFLIEVQALVSTAAYGTPQRSATGFDLRRLSMLLAVLEKRAGFHLASKDVFLNIAGGIKVNDPAIDMAVICAILSSNIDIAINSDVCFAGEVGLSGEIRPVNRVEQRISEADKLGFKKILISKYNKKNIEIKTNNIDIITVNKIEDVFKNLFG